MASSPILILSMATLAIFGLMVASPCAAQSTLSSPHSLSTGRYLVNRNFRLTMRPDCNLVLTDKGVTIWQTNTYRPAGNNCRLKLYNDGNLAIYNHRDELVWQTGNKGQVDSYALVLQPDRNLVVYGPLVWATYTTIHTAGPHNASATVDVAVEQVIKSASATAMLE